MMYGSFLFMQTDINFIKYQVKQNMIEKKLERLKRLVSDLDQEKLQNNHKIDSISLISQNLSRTNKSSFAKQPPSTPTPNLTLTLTLNPKTSESPHLQKLSHKTQSLHEPSSPLKSPNRLLTYVNEQNRRKMEELARRLYEARIIDMNIKESEIGWQEFLKTFLLKNSRNGEFRADRVDLSGLGIVGNCLVVVSEILTDYRVVDLSRNIIKTNDIINIRQSKRLQELILKNCGMKNEDLCLLFTILLETPIKRLSISSPDIKDRNNLTRYEELYKLIEQSQTLEALQLSNVQISPDSTIFQSAKKSKSLHKLDLSKNTGVSGISKNLTDLNLSWNGLKKPNFLRCTESALQNLDITGNPIPCYLFEDYLITTNYQDLKQLTLNKIALNYEVVWLQNFIEKSRSLEKLCLVDCSMTKISLLGVAFGLERNRSLKLLNLSGNKIYDLEVVKRLVVSIKSSILSHLYLQLCDITDEAGSILFTSLHNNTSIEYIDISKNLLSQRTSQTICNSLKSSCYSLLTLITTQNFMKYDQLREIQGYISRNVYMAKMKVLDQHRRYKSMNASNTEAVRKIQEAERKLVELREEAGTLEDEYMRKQKENEAIDALIMEEQIRLLKEEEALLEKKFIGLQSQLDNLNSHNPEHPHPQQQY